MPADVILRIPETVKEDTFTYRSRVRKYLDGGTTPVAFRAYRVPMGIYEQRTTGRFMVRVRIPAGLALPEQLDKIAGLSKRFGSGVLHVTSRQDIQIHAVSIEDTPDVLEGLFEANLSPRGGGGNTVRNVSACPRAGVCPNEAFDVSPCAVATAEYLLADRSSFNLPRKFKLAFSGCSADCAFASVADLGFFAHEKDGVKGFSVYCGGGLGGSPRVGVKIEDFVAAEEVFEIAEAVKQLFDKHGDRSNKHRARLRYVLERLGQEEFVERYRQQRRKVQADSLPYDAPDIRRIVEPTEPTETSDQAASQRLGVQSESTPGRVTVRLWLTNGDIPAGDLKKVARIAAAYGQGVVRTTQLQDLLITGVAQGDLAHVEADLAQLETNVFKPASVKTVACAGASTCKLGLCLSRGLAEAITARLDQTSLPDSQDQPVIRISGCPNSCGHHCISDLGFQGRAKRLGGRLVPYYDVFVGARTVEGEAHLAECVGSVPARRVPDLVAEAFKAGATDAEQIGPIVARYADVSDAALPDETYCDWGADVPFSLAGRGPGECGAGVMDIIVVDIDQAKDAVKTAATDSDSAYRAIVAAARALLVTFGLEPGTDREIFAAFTERLVEPGWVAGSARQLLEAAMDWRMGDLASLEDLAPQIEDLTDRVAALFASLDASLKFTVEPVSQAEAPADQGTAEAKHSVDLRGVACPMNFVKAKLALEQIDVGEVLEVLLDAGEPARNAPASFAEQGQDVLEVTDVGGHFRVRVQRTS